MKCAALVLNYNGELIVGDCVDSLFSQGIDIDVYVIDNGSTDSSGTLLSTLEVTTCHLYLNQSFTSAYNTCYERIKWYYDYTLLVSNDVSCNPSCLTKLLSRMSSDDSLALVAPSSIRPDGSFDIIAKSRLRVIDLFRSYTILPSISGRSSSIRNPPQDIPCSPQVLQDSALLIRNRHFLGTPLFDERFHFYYTEDSLCNAILERGLRIFYEPSASVNHLVSYSTERLSLAWSYKQAYRDCIAFVSAYHGPYLFLFLLLSLPKFICVYFFFLFKDQTRLLTSR